MQTQMNLKTTVVSERSQTPPYTNTRVHTVRFHTRNILENAKESIVTASRSELACGGGHGEQGMRKEHKATFGSD